MPAEVMKLPLENAAGKNSASQDVPEDDADDTSRSGKWRQLTHGEARILQNYVQGRVQPFCLPDGSERWDLRPSTSVEQVIAAMAAERIEGVTNHHITGAMRALGMARMRQKDHDALKIGPGLRSLAGNATGMDLLKAFDALRASQERMLAMSNHQAIELRDIREWMTEHALTHARENKENAK